MHFEFLSTELVVQIFHSCETVTDALNLGATCQHFQKIIKSSRRLPILYAAAETEIGPLSEAIRLATYTRPQHLYHPQQRPPQSFALLSRLLIYGRVANTWATIYPFEKWTAEASSSRHLLSRSERYVLRRACYRLWLYGTAWHNPQHGRLLRNQVLVVRERATMLRIWSTEELAEMQDLQNVFRSILAEHVCPSNGTVLRRYKERFPSVANSGSSMLRVFSLGSVNDKLSYDLRNQLHVTRLQTLKHHVNSRKCNASKARYPTMEGWGDEISHYYLLEDMLKLNPQQILELYQLAESVDTINVCDCQPSVAQSVESMLTQWDCSADWFENNGETFAGTVQTVVTDRGDEYSLFDEAIGLNQQGIVKEVACTDLSGGQY